MSLTFLLGAPRSGTTLLERMLACHSLIKGGPEPHLLTPLAYLGYWGRVDKAPYDHIVASAGQKAFIEALPHKEQDYWKACRRYCDSLYAAYMTQGAETICVDKTPEYTTIWPFLSKVYPDARYIVLTRHPAAILSSFANSFFDGDFDIAQQHDPILERYVPALAGFLRQTDVPFFHLSYEDLVCDPEQWLRKICAFLQIPYEPGMVDYGSKYNRHAAGMGLGDPIGISQHSRPTDSNINKSFLEYAGNAHKSGVLRKSLARIDPADLATIGYPEVSFWDPIDTANHGTGAAPRKTGLTRYRLQRKLIVKLRGLTQRNSRVRAGVGWLRMVCDVLLREY